jgi:hypothetical protein
MQNLEKLKWWSNQKKCQIGVKILRTGENDEKDKIAFRHND